MTAARAEFEKLKVDIFNQGRDQGREVALRAILDICGLLGLETSTEQRARLEKMPLLELEQVRCHLMQHRTLPV